jgi:diaminopimelate decarboxylase
MINLGGGLGVNYSEPVENPVPDFHSFFKLFHENLQIPGHVSRHFELGRSLTAQCGRLVTRVLFVKHGTLNNHVIVDTGMTELIRPALYGASHCIENITADGKTEPYDVVGPICESSDCFGKEVFLPATSRGDFLVIHSCGAYAESMGMNYNLRGAIGKLYVKGGMLRPGPRLQLQIRHVPSAKALHEVLPG